MRKCPARVKAQGRQQAAQLGCAGENEWSQQIGGFGGKGFTPPQVLPNSGGSLSLRVPELAAGNPPPSHLPGAGQEPCT